MPLKSHQNHELKWTNLLEDVAGTSWLEIAISLFHKNHGFSNYRKCKRRDHTLVRECALQDEKIKKYIEADSNNGQKVEKILDEMCHLLSTQSNPTRKLKIAGTPFLRCITQIYSGIYISNHLSSISGTDQSEIGHLFKEQYLRLSKELPVVILPTHRSYMDFLLITFIMFNNELPLPIVAAGDNFKAMGKFLTNFLKGTGAFLIRRNAHNKRDIEAAAYYDILRAYVHSIIKGGENPLEFFMEGTRTRVGHVMRPKTGLLSMVVDMYMDELVDDIYILPVSISYQRPIEEQLYVAEITPQVGMKKPKESAKNLFAAFETIMKKKYGKVYVRFVEPFKLSDYFEQWKRTDTGRTTDNRDIILHEFTNSLATKVCLAQAYNNILMPFNLVSFSALSRSFFNNTLGIGLSPEQDGSVSSEASLIQVPFDVVVNDFRLIEELLIKTQPQFVPGWKNHLDILNEFALDRDGIVRASPERKFIEFTQDATTFHTMLYYSNQVAQTLLPVTICLLLLNEDSPSGSTTNSRWEQFKSIRLLLSREFLVDNLSLEDEFKRSLRAIENYPVSKEARDVVVKHLAYYVQSYLVFLNYLNEHSPFTRMQFLCSSTLQQLGLFISKDMLKNMIDIVKDMDICKTLPDDEHQERGQKLNGQKGSNPSEEKLEVKNRDKLEQLAERFQQVLRLTASVLES